MWLATGPLSVPQTPEAQKPKGEQTQRGSPPMSAWSSRSNATA